MYLLKAKVNPSHACLQSIQGYKVTERSMLLLAVRCTMLIATCHFFFFFLTTPPHHPHPGPGSAPPRRTTDEKRTCNLSPTFPPQE